MGSGPHQGLSHVSVIVVPRESKEATVAVLTLGRSFDSIWRG